MIRLENMTKVYTMGKRELTVLRGVNVHIKRGEMVAIMGPYGSGKTTMLNMLGCLDVPTSGSYFLDGREVSRLNSKELTDVRAHKIGFIFQSYNLLPQISALANVELGQRYAGCPDTNRALEALERVGLADRAHHKPSEMSGGEQQRVSIARAIVKTPPLILADEPTGNLDSKSGSEIMSILADLYKDHDNTLIMITHEAEIAHYCQRILHFRDGLVVNEESI